MKIISAYAPKCRASTVVGSPEYCECSVKFSPDGNMFIERGKVKNRQAEINSYKESCMVANLVKRYENGDQLALLRGNTGAYADLSDLPKNIHEAQKLSRSIHSLYDSMGDDIKAKYANVEEFCTAFSTKSSFDEFVSFSRDVVKQRASKVKKPESEVKSNA